jgi:CheY-like chemotaxis protein
VQWAQQVVDRQVNQLVRLVDDLLDASRISSGKLALRTAVVDVLPVINDAIEANRPLAERKQHVVKVDLPAAPLHVEGDAVRLTQVFLNLLNNAVKYSPAGARIHVSVEADDGFAVTRIRDEGVGIVAEDLPRVFDMFYQGTAGVDDTQGGLGLGLALVRQLVELHGGEVAATSAGPGQGSEFVVRIPAKVQVESTLPVMDTHVANVSSALRRILVVDDNRDAAESLAMILRMEGNEVDMAFDGEAAVSAIATFRPDIVLMDLGMPKLDGYEAARAIRRAAGGHEVVLVALTGWRGDSDRELSQQAGFDRHLVKPVVPTELIALLSTLGPRITH